MKPAAALIITLLTLSSCYSYKIFPKEIRNYSYSGPKQKAYVVHPELKEEYKILCASKIFDLTTDSAGADVNIVLYHFKKSLACGQPALGTLITLGQIPVLLPDRYQYRFDEISKGGRTHHTIEMKIATRFWFWDLFAFHKKFDEKAGQILLSAYYTVPESPIKLAYSEKGLY
jgi:hypothetical protein